MANATKQNENLLTAKAISKFNIISPFKVRRVVNKLRGMRYDKAMAIMSVIPNKAAKIVEKTIKSAFYNLDAKFENVDPEKVVVHQVLASPGPILKRIKPRARGRADRIKKRTTHVTVVVSTEQNTGDNK
jgi:large subunit ribosomal protein L22